MSIPWWAFMTSLAAAFLGGVAVSIAWRGRDLRGQHSFHAPEVSVAATIKRVRAGNRLDAEIKARDTTPRDTPPPRARTGEPETQNTAVIPAARPDEHRQSAGPAESTGRHHRRLPEAS